jgi:uncharacterized protein (TIGR00106 family)
MVLLEFSVFPIDKGASLSAYVARAIDIVDRSGLPYRLGPMGTVVEGEWDEVFDVVRRCVEELEKDSERITLSIKADCRRGAAGRLTGKIEAVERRLGRKLDT